MGIQQQRQALQTGAYQQQSALAESQLAQQKAAELQRVGSLVQNADQYKKPDGSFDSISFSNDVKRVAPAFGGEIANQAVSNANELVQNRKALQDLNDSQRKALGDSSRALAQKTDLSVTDIINEADRQLENNQDPGFRRMILSNLAHLPARANSQQLQQFMGQYANAASGEGPGAVALPTGQVGTRNAATGAVAVAPSGIGANPIVPQATTNAAGQIINRNPVSGALSPAPTAAVPTAPAPINPTAPEVAEQQALAARVQQAQGAANNTIQSQDALERARVLLDNPNLDTGAAFDRQRTLSNLMASAGIDTQGATDANTLVKNLARYEASRATQAGLGGTDAARDLSHQGNPNTQIDKGALKGIVTQSLATEKAIAAYGNAQAKATGNIQQQAKNEAAFRSIPHLIEGYEYGLARTPQEAEAFLQKHDVTRQQMAQTRAMIKQFEAQ